MSITANLLEPDAVGVAVSVGADVGVAVAPLVRDFAQDDDAGGTAVDAQCAAGADVFVDDEEDAVFEAVAGLVAVDGFVLRGGGAAVAAVRVEGQTSDVRD